MSAKAVIKPFKVLENGNMATSQVSVVTNIETSDDVGYQVVWTGNAIGTFAVEASINGVNWEELDLGSPGPAAAGSSDSFLISLGLIPYPQVRLTYTASSGTGSLNVWVCAKRIGG